ncbi:MAG: ATP synthase F1 subunit epsilon [Selenomonadaceae bacterium]|nr:ATP synthase F1 subunit epsilon [Selenomonadaceae bacterium]MBQ1510583.1 ATP synthase F1 subunit epsilon [Selenomonadaceae bacterium]MBQ3970747.1 ATP synthase F1 subunit epsilon [Selenomonadaceae bacterium]
MATIKLEVVSPDRVVYANDIAMLIVRSTAGELGILPRHAPLVTGLIPHAMRVKLPGESEERLLAVAGGFMEVTPEKITVLASAAEEPEAIDVNRAQKAYQRAKERIAAFHQSVPESTDIDMGRAELALQRAKARLMATKTHFDD